MRRTAALLLCACLCGCGILVGMAQSGCAERIYAGTRIDFGILTHPFGALGSCETIPVWLIWPFVLCDLPLALVADTLLLPCTIPHDVSLAEPEPAPGKPSP